jgi:septum formation protein
LRLVLASSSPRRSALLASVDIKPHLIISPDIDETPLSKEKPCDYAQRMAYNKMIAVKDNYQHDIILTADTVVAKGRRILPKAENDSDFYHCIKLLSGGRHHVFTAISVCNPDGKITVKVIKTTVKVRKLLKQDIESFKKTMEWQSKAGGYALQGFFGQFIEFISGSYSSVIGLPVYETVKLLKQNGYHNNVACNGVI